jgi:hypothetical protein
MSMILNYSKVMPCLKLITLFAYDEVKLNSIVSVL